MRSLLYCFVTLSMFLFSAESRYSGGKLVDSIVTSTSGDFDGLVSTNSSHVFTLFHSFLCKTRECMKAFPHWVHIFDTYHHYNGEPVSMLALDCTNAGRDACVDQQIGPTPVLQYDHNGTSVKYSGKMNYKSISSWILETAPEIFGNPKSIEPADSCVAFRRTSDCDGVHGARLPEKDVACSDTVRDGAEGYCECMDEDGNITRLKQTGCSHKPFRCYDYCRRSEVCDGWYQTSSCDPSSDRDNQHDASCFDRVFRGNSGYCKCKDGSRVDFSCDHDTIYCETVCREQGKEDL